MAIWAQGLRKSFVVQERRAGFLGGAADLIRPRVSVREAVAGIDLRVDDGEMVGFIGPNGAGKSTTLRMLTGVLMPSGGSALVNGFLPFAQRTRCARTIGAVFGGRATLWPELPPRDSYGLLRVMYGVSANDFARSLTFLCDALELGPLLSRPVREMSLGQRMRCELAAAFLHDPQAVFLDEPTIGLDAQVKRNLHGFFRAMRGKSRAAVLLTSHDLTEVEETCARLILLHEGRILFDGPQTALRRRFAGRRRIELRLAPAGDAQAIAGYAASLAPSVQAEAGPQSVQVRFADGALDVPAFLAALCARFPGVQDIGMREQSIEEIVANAYDAASVGKADDRGGQEAKGGAADGVY